MNPLESTDSRIWRIGTRGSALALRQTSMVIDALQAALPGFRSEMVIIRTEGDARPDVPLVQMAGQGVFVAEIERALQRNDIDFAIHSAKDLPSSMTGDLALAAFLPRADVRDALVPRAGVVTTLMTLPAGSRVGTSSPRRTAQLLHCRPDFVLLEIRGNVDTRLRKLDSGEYDAIVLACAGLDRLGFTHRIAERIDPNVMIPAPGQGAIALQCRASDTQALQLAAHIDDLCTRTAVTAERAFLARLGAGCTTPAGASARWEDGKLRMDAFLQVDQRTQIRENVSGNPVEAATLGKVIADLLIARAKFVESASPLQGSAAADLI
jgi:hydroxymethylbilane synthase